MIKQSVDNWLDSVNYEELNNYTPSEFALQFMNFIKLVNGVEGESNKTPPMHLKMLDKLTSKEKYVVNLVFRGSGKTSIFAEYLFPYVACFHKLPCLGDISGAIYVSDSIDNGVKSLRKNLEFRYNHSDFLQNYLPKVSFTDTYIEFTNQKGQMFGLKLFGATTGLRGTKIFGKRPTLCHVKGTTVFTDMGKHLVEDYYLKGPSRYLKGIDVYCAGFIHKETVTPEHRYFIGSTIKTRNKKYLENNKTKSITKLEYINPRWVEAKDISINKLLGHQQVQNDYICERLELPYHIRNTRTKEKLTTFPNGITSLVHKQYEIRLSQNVSKVLGIQITEKKSNEVFIKDGYIWRKIKEIKLSDKEQEFIPIQTPDHTYNTYFGISHNCVMDDLISDEASKSKVVMQAIKDTVYKGVNYALDPTKRKIIFNGTPFNKEDIMIEAVESGGWDVNVYPVCEKFPCTKEEFKGAWEDRFPYDSILEQYEMNKATGKLPAFYQELMLRINSADDRLVQDDEIRWYSRIELLENRSNFNIYITTDFATSAKQTADFSVISVWAYNNNGDWFWVDGICAKQTMDKSIDDLFRLVQEYQPASVGIEVTGQQGAFLQWISKEMMSRNIWFNFASTKNTPGIRPTTDKLTRFNLMVPLFKAGKMYFPNEMKNTDIMKEFMQQISLSTRDGIKGHDDCIDTISMLTYMNAWKPSLATPVLKQDNIQKGLWEFKDTSPESGAYDSYIV